jgi:transposase-like protein
VSRICPYCQSPGNSHIGFGSFVRRSDKRRVFRFKCQECFVTFSQATFQKCYRQKKRYLNGEILRLLCSGVSQRRVAILLNINRKTVVRKFLFLAARIRALNQVKYQALPQVSHIQFDDLETFEHTKCKPLSVTLAVDKLSRRVLGFNVSQMPPKGHLARISYKKYGYRKDLRAKGRRLLFLKLGQKLTPTALIDSDSSPFYPQDVKRFFPQAQHQSFLGKRGSIVGQGELKKVRFDPLFSVNHTFAMLRANINRLFRKTWCTTKDPRRLSDHIELYTYYHNEVLLKRKTA